MTTVTQNITLTSFLLGIFSTGIGESGKSTIFKQMKILQIGGGFSTEEAISYRNLVYLNLITDMKAMLAAAARFQIQMSTQQNQVSNRAFFSCEVDVTEGLFIGVCRVVPYSSAK